MVITYCGTCGGQVRSQAACPKCFPQAKTESQVMPSVRAPLPPRRRAVRRFLLAGRA